MPFKNRKEALFNQQKYHAARRNIPFNLTFNEWSDWWETNLGPDWLTKRGRGKGKFCMIRIGDAGDYSIGNIKCGTFEQNCCERKENKTSAHGIKNAGVKLTEDQVRAIYKSKKSQTALAKIFGVSHATTQRIKVGKGWKNLLRKE